MELVELTKIYKTLEVLESMVDISRGHFENKNLKNSHPLEKATSFSFGRQCGHTKAITDYITKHDNHIGDVIVVCRNESMKTLHYSDTSRGIPLSTCVDEINRMIFRGREEKSVTLFFDSCDPEGIRKFFNKLYACRNTYSTIGSVVIVAPTF